MPIRSRTYTFWGVFSWEPHGHRLNDSLHAYPLASQSNIPTPWSGFLWYLAVPSYGTYSIKILSHISQFLPNFKKIAKPILEKCIKQGFIMHPCVLQVSVSCLRFPVLYQNLRKIFNKKNVLRKEEGKLSAFTCIAVGPPFMIAEGYNLRIFIFLVFLNWRRVFGLMPASRAWIPTDRKT